MPEKDLKQVVAELEGLLVGGYLPPAPEPVDFGRQALFGGLSGVSLPSSNEILLPGLELHETYAHLFTAPIVAFAPPPNPRAPHPAPWEATRNGGLAETVMVELRLAEGAKPFDLSRVDCLRLVTSMIRLIAAVPVSLPLLSDLSFAEPARSERRPNIWHLEVFTQWPRFNPVELNSEFFEILRMLLEPASLILQDDEVNRAFALADGVWWLPSLSAQMTTIWSAAETLMRPGRLRTGEHLAKAVRTYIGKNRSDGDRIYNDVAQLYGARGSTAHAGHAPKPNDVRASFLIVREILLRAFAEGKRPPIPEEMVPLW